MSRRLTQLFSRFSLSQPGKVEPAPQVPSPEEAEYHTALENGCTAKTNGDNALAESLLTKAISGYESLAQSFPPNATRTKSLLSAQHNLAMLYLDQSRFEEAEKLLRASLKGKEDFVGHKHKEVMDIVHNLAIVLRANQKWADADEMYNRESRLSSKLQGKLHFDTLSAINNSGNMKEMCGDQKNAEALYRRALAGFEREDVLGPMHTTTLTVMHNLGGAYMAQGKYAEAESFFRRALQGREKILRPDDEDTIAAVENLASALSKHNQERKLNSKQDQRVEDMFSESDKLHRRAMNLSEKKLGPDHPMTLDCGHNLAVHFRDTEREDEAEKMFQRILEARERVLGKDDEATAMTVYGMGRLHILVGRLDEGESMFRRVLERHESVLGKEHPRTVDAAKNVDEILQFMRQEGEGVAPKQRRFELTRKLRGYRTNVP